MNDIFFYVKLNNCKLIHLQSCCYQTETQFQTVVWLLTSQKSILKRQVMVRKERLLYSGSLNLGRWWTNVLKTVFPVQVKVGGFKGEGVRNGGGYMQGKLMLCQLIICQHHPQQACWHQWQLFLMGSGLIIQECLVLYSSRQMICKISR